MTGINDFIDNEVKTNDVVLFMKGTPGFPQCGFSGQVVQILTISAWTTKASTSFPQTSCVRASRNTPTGQLFLSFM